VHECVERTCSVDAVFDTPKDRVGDLKVLSGESREGLGTEVL
jgi:hypothetical protein